MISLGKIWKLGDALDDTAKQLGLERKLKQQRILDEWREIVGDAIANVAEIRRLDYGRLMLHVSNAVWRQEISLGKENLRKKINDAVGEEIITDIIVR